MLQKALMSSYLLVIMNRQIVHCSCIDKEVGKLLLENVYERKIIDIMSLEKQIKNETIINMSVSDIRILQSSKCCSTMKSCVFTGVLGRRKFQTTIQKISLL